jgi:hypothetical protein
VSNIEHLLVAEAGTDDRSRYAIMTGVRVEDPAAAAARLDGAGADDDVIDVLRAQAFEIRIAFASKQKLASIGEDWRYAFIHELVECTFNPNRHARRIGGYPLIAHLPEGIPFDVDWLGAYLTNTTYSGARVQTRIVRRDAPLLALPALVARLFHDAVEDDRGRPGAARERYNAIASRVTHLEDLGLHISYWHRGTGADAIVRAASLHG